jgi:NADH-quinone oxidoreductase subunit J
MMEALFYIASFVALFATLQALSRSNAAHALIYLIVSLLAVAVIFFLMGAPFAAALEIVIYAGAIMVLFVFVIMLLDLGPRLAQARPQLGLVKVAGIIAVLAIGWRTVGALQGLIIGTGRPVDGSVLAIGRLLLTDYIFGFEAVSLMLLVAVVGAVVLGLKRLT